MNNMPPVTKNLLIINILVFFACQILPSYGIDVMQYCALHYIVATDFAPHQFFTYMFLHDGWMHLFFNMFALWMFGRLMEQVMGSQRFLFYYVVCGLGAAFCQELAQFINFSQYEMVEAAINSAGEIVPGKYIVMDGAAVDLNLCTTVGASGCIFGILLSFGMTFPNERMFIIPFPFPIKAKYMVLGYAVVELLSAMLGARDKVAHVAHLGGMLFGFFILMYWRYNQRNGGMGGRNIVGNMFANIRQRMSGGSSPRMKVHRGGKHADEMDYNARRRAQDEEIDRILDKVKKHGYGCLTEDEKRKLFDASGRK